MKASSFQRITPETKCIAIMKALRLTIVFVACGLMASAQTGITGGWNLNTYQYRLNGVQYGRSSTAGFNIGMFYRASLDRSVIIEPTLLFTRKGGVNASTPYPIDYNKTRLDYIELGLPIMYRAWIDRGMDFSIGAGPYLGLLAHADAITQYANGDQIRGEYTVGSGNPNDFKPLDAGLRFAAGLRFGRTICLSAAYDLGLADIAPAANEEFRTRTFSLNLGFMFW
jgi:hypothetical protein